jgi:hypothetical protein
LRCCWYPVTCVSEFDFQGLVHLLFVLFLSVDDDIPHSILLSMFLFSSFSCTDPHTTISARIFLFCLVSSFLRIGFVFISERDFPGLSFLETRLSFSLCLFMWKQLSLLEEYEIKNETVLIRSKCRDQIPYQSFFVEKEGE